MQTDILKKKVKINTSSSIDPRDENKELLKKYPGVWNGIKNKTKTINIGECDVNKTTASKECDICHYWYFKVLSMNCIFAMAVTI